jgi:hypothetical protein
MMFIDRPTRPGDYEYTLTAIDESGWESPRSHRAVASRELRIVAPKPAGRAIAGKDFGVRATVISDADVTQVAIVYRPVANREWQHAPMVRTFRNSYAGVIPAAALQAGTVVFYVEAGDDAGQRAVWPESAVTGLPWSVTA